MNKPSIPQGMRDFSADTVRKRGYLLSTLRNVFELYGFEPLETPAMENLDTLMGKYGEEGDKLIFKVLNNGLENPAKREQALADWQKILEGKNTSGITERALRYDLTIPFARYVAMNQGKLALPFRRYQIQPVWRADRPQRGRYREFTQCDADIVGSGSFRNEVELVNLYREAFRRLKLPVEIRINNRKVLAALSMRCGGNERMMDITIAIDKMDKIGLEKVKEELLARGLEQAHVGAIEEYLLIRGTNQEKLAAAAALLDGFAEFREGAAELQATLDRLEDSAQAPVIVDFTLARGLNYYTGTILEVKATGAAMGSIGGGGRYDNLTALFGGSPIEGVGISFGVDRIYDVMEELDLFPDSVATGTQALFFHLGKAEADAAYRLVTEVRAAGVSAELYPDKAKMDKQFRYAERRSIPFAVIIGETELASGNCQVKDLRSGKQLTLRQHSLATFLSGDGN